MAQLLQATGPTALPRLGALLQDDCPMVRAAAVTAIRGLLEHGGDDAAVVPPLVLALRDPDSGVRLTAAEALRSSGPKASNAVPVLTAWLRVRQGPRARYFLRAAADTLGGIGPAANGAIPLLTDLLNNDGNPAVRMDAAIALWRIDHRTNATLSFLLKALSSPISGTGPDPASTKRMLEVLAEMGSAATPAVPLLMKMTEATNQASSISTQVNACAALLSVDSRLSTQLVPVLASVLDNGWGQRADLQLAATLLGKIGPPAERALFQLLRLERYPDTNVSRQATLALQQIYPLRKNR